ncbi:MAG TPA: disulfide bond formation protein DsbA [Acidimicrobiaceae bacterium]|jgi:2-hydroxychromene-2-carboxylate isomerase|nr:disulfide bond formation protein DsbA [Acidimicrobiaceae bacterium]
MAAIFSLISPSAQLRLSVALRNRGKNLLVYSRSGRAGFKLRRPESVEDAVKLEFWIDPACPWCWLTSRWIEDIAPERDLDVVWRPISLKFKNDLDSSSPYFEAVSYTHGLLRVMEAVRSVEGDAPLGRLYTVFGQRIHHEGDLTTAPADLLSEAGLDSSYAHAFEDESWDVAIRESMADGLGLTGEDVGTPILAFKDQAGKRVGFFGPVISRRLALDEGLRLWDGISLAATVEGFWELKRTRTVEPDFSPAS